MAMQVSFVRHRGRRDHVHVMRSDGSSADWAFPSYGNELPHDLCHLVVEDALGIAEGFWGLLDEGMDVALVDNQATLVRNGRPLIEDPSVDFSDLNSAEQAVALLSSIGMHTEEVGTLTLVRLDPAAPSPPSTDLLRSELGFGLPPNISEETILQVRERLADLRRQWQGLDDGSAIVLTYHGKTP
jgi:hypothetical protein